MSDGAEALTRLQTAAAQVAALVPSLADRSLTSVQRRRTLDGARRALAELERAADDAAAHLGARNGVPPIHPGEAEPLCVLSRCNAALEEAKAELYAAVDAARAAGASWRRIGEALGIAAQSAHKRFDPRARRRHADYMRERYRPARPEV